jgi:hypothetical protein
MKMIGSSIGNPIVFEDIPVLYIVSPLQEVQQTLQ